MAVVQGYCSTRATISPVLQVISFFVQEGITGAGESESFGFIDRPSQLASKIPVAVNSSRSATSLGLPRIDEM